MKKAVIICSALALAGAALAQSYGLINLRAPKATQNMADARTGQPGEIVHVLTNQFGEPEMRWYDGSTQGGHLFGGGGDAPYFQQVHHTGDEEESGALIDAALEAIYQAQIDSSGDMKNVLYLSGRPNGVYERYFIPNAIQFDGSFDIVNPTMFSSPQVWGEYQGGYGDTVLNYTANARTLFGVGPFAFVARTNNTDPSIVFDSDGTTYGAIKGVFFTTMSNGVGHTVFEDVGFGGEWHINHASDDSVEGFIDACGFTRCSFANTWTSTHPVDTFMAAASIFQECNFKESFAMSGGAMRNCQLDGSPGLITSYKDFFGFSTNFNSIAGQYIDCRIDGSDGFMGADSGTGTVPPSPHYLVFSGCEFINTGGTWFEDITIDSTIEFFNCRGVNSALDGSGAKITFCTDENGNVLANQ